MKIAARQFLHADAFTPMTPTDYWVVVPAAGGVVPAGVAPSAGGGVVVASAGAGVVVSAGAVGAATGAAGSVVAGAVAGTVVSVAGAVVSAFLQADRLRAVMAAASRMEYFMGMSSLRVDPAGLIQ
jgi:hypothetical protein